MSSTGPTALPPSLLLSVLGRVPGVLTLIAPYLFPRHKLTQLTRVCRSFPHLSPACFRGDQLDLSERTAVVLPQLSRQHSTLALLSLVADLRCVYKVDDDERAAVNAHFLALFDAATPQPVVSPACTFPFLRSLALTVPSDNPYFLQRLFAHTPSRFPHLTTLDAGCESTETDLLRLDVQLLCNHAPALTSLTLRCCSIDGRSLRLLCSLPLLKLDCTDQVDALLDVDDVEDNNVQSTEEQTVGTATHSLRVLLFPSLQPMFTAPRRLQLRLVNHLLQQYTAPASQSPEPSGMEEDEWKDGREIERRSSGLVALHLFGEDLPLNTLGIIATLTTVTWLDLSDCCVCSVLSLLDNTRKPRLRALRHFTAPVPASVEWTEEDMDEEEEEEEEREELAAVGELPGRGWASWAAVLSAYAPQLQLLEHNLPARNFLAEGIPLMEAVLTAHDLRELSLGVSYKEAEAEEAEEEIGEQQNVGWARWFGPLCSPQRIPLQHVGDLVLYALPLRNDELSNLLQLLPNIQDCRLADMWRLTIDVLPHFTACRGLRRLEVIAEDTSNFLVLPFVYRAPTVAGQRAALLPQLQFFSVAGRYTSLHYAEGHLAPLARLLAHDAPNLRYLYLDIDCTPPTLAPFAALPNLRAFRAFLSLPPALARFYRRPPCDERACMWREYHRDRPQYKCEVMSVSEMECMELVRDVRAGWDKERQQRRDDCYVFASGEGGYGGGGWDVSEAAAIGRWGRRGFFGAVTAMESEGTVH